MSSYLGMNATTGRRITDTDHFDQSVGKILGTSIGTRLRRRPFGSKAPDLIDAPGNSAAIVQLYAAAATALMMWEPRLTLRQVSAQTDPARPGLLALDVVGERMTNQGPQPVRVSSVLRG